MTEAHGVLTAGRLERLEREIIDTTNRAVQVAAWGFMTTAAASLGRYHGGPKRSFLDSTKTEDRGMGSQESPIKIEDDDDEGSCVFSRDNERRRRKRRDTPKVIIQPSSPSHLEHFLEVQVEEHAVQPREYRGNTALHKNLALGSTPDMVRTLMKCLSD